MKLGFLSPAFLSRSGARWLATSAVLGRSARTGGFGGLKSRDNSELVGTRVRGARTGLAKLGKRENRRERGRSRRRLVVQSAEARAQSARRSALAQEKEGEGAAEREDEMEIC